MAYQIFDRVELWTTTFHAFVKVGDKFYDSEALAGVLDWKQLPCCARRLQQSVRSYGDDIPAEQLSCENFIRLWDKGQYRKHDWSGCDSLVENWMKYATAPDALG